MRLRGLLLPTLLSALLLLLGPVQAQGVNAKNLLKLGRSAADNKDWAKARDYATQALAEEGGYLDAYYLRAFAYCELGEKKKAEEDFREVIRRDPAFLPTYGALADMLIADKEWDKVEKVFNDLSAQDNGAKWASYYRGVVAYTRGDLKKAEAQWKDALAKDVNFASASHNLGAIALAKKDYTRALSYFTDALEQDEDNVMYRFHLAWACERTGQLSKAQEQLKRISNEGGDDGRFWLLSRAYSQVLNKQFDNASKVLDTVVKDNPDMVEAWILKARCLQAAGQNEPARAALEKAKEADPQFSEVDDLMAKLPPKPAETAPPSPAPNGDGKTAAPAPGTSTPNAPPDPPANPPETPANPPVRQKPPQP